MDSTEKDHTAIIDEKMNDSTLDDDEVTVTSGTRTSEKEQVEHEILVRFHLPVRSNGASAKQLQSHIVFTILKAYANDMVYIDHKKEEMVYTEMATEEKVFQQVKKSSMQVHEIRRKNKESNDKRWVSVIKFRTHIPYRDWKKHESIMMVLRKEKVYMHQHYFAHNDWDVISIGFLLGIHIVQFPKQAAKEHLDNLMKGNETEHPQYDLQPAKVQLKGKPTYTRAHEVACLRKDGPKLYHIMTHDKFREPNNKIFVPYSLKRSNANTFISLIKENNQMLSDSYVMKVQGIQKRDIDYIKPHILKVPGVRFMVPTAKVATHGEWRILIKSSKFHGVNRYIRQKWDEWCKDIPQDSAEKLPTSFPAAEITSRNVRSNDSQDDNSEDSYGTLLTTESMFTMGTLTDTDLYDECPLDDYIPTYAEATSSGTASFSSPTSTITASIYPVRELDGPKNHTQEPTSNHESNLSNENHELQCRLREQEARIQDLDNAKTMLDNRLQQILEEVQNKECRAKELEDRIANLLDVVADRDKQMMERDQQFERRNQQFDALMARLEIQHTHSSPSPRNHSEHENNDALQMPVTPARSNKRQNTLPTPRRDRGDTSDDDPDDIMHDVPDGKNQYPPC